MFLSVLLTEKTPKTPEKKYQCHCGKKYKHMSSLCAHKKTCTKKEDKSEVFVLTNLVM